ncbi:MAG: glycerol-3-phosphate 1-O-acyltransferase PlsY [Alphaproteobacteria bacterium]|nr:glycerol-3-phosphate 1-O-acyltransferase PlsY [Alphaproteobacteria bacterium]
MPEPADISHIILSLTFGYALGSLPFGWLITKFIMRKDIRDSGSGNPGATNVFRTEGKIPGALTLLCDTLKATVAVFIAYLFIPATSELPALIAASGAILGHIFPIWLKFKGGKGVATFLGALLGLSWPAATFFIIIWVHCIFFVRISSFSSLTATLVTTVLFYGMGRIDYAIFSTLITILIWIMHHQNIRNMIEDKETRIFRKISKTENRK